MFALRREGPGLAETSCVTILFVAKGEKTEVVVAHGHITSEETRQDHEHGWNGCLAGLAAYAGDG